MRITFLIQRLKRPRHATGPLAKAHRVFGGGMMALSEQQWDFVDQAFEIDYMGAAEYEFGSFGKAMQMLMEANERVAFGIVIDRKDVALNGSRSFNKKLKKADAPSEPAVVYVLCQTGLRDEIEKRIRQLANDGIESLRWVRDDTFMHRTLDPLNEWDEKTVGWLEIDNGFFFFTDKEMWRAVCAWFDLETKDVEAEIEGEVVARRAASPNRRARKKRVREPRNHQAG